MFIISWMTRAEVDHWEVCSDRKAANEKAKNLQNSDDVACWAVGFVFDGSEPHYIEGNL